MTKRCFASLVLLLLTATACIPQVPKGPPARLPSFVFYTLEGNKAVNQDALAKEGNVVLIFFDPGCSHCRKEISALGDNFKEVKQAMLYLVSQQERPLVREFMNSYGKKIRDKPNVHVLIDSHYQFLPLFNPVQYPALYVYGEDRKLKTYIDGEKPIAKVLSAINSGY